MSAKRASLHFSNTLLVAAALFAAPMAQAAPLIGLVPMAPDIAVSALQIQQIGVGQVGDAGVIFNAQHTVGSFFSPPAGSSVTSITNGSYALTTTGQTGTLSIRGDIDGAGGGGVVDLLVGNVIRAGENGVRAPGGATSLEFLLNVTSFNASVGNFGSKAGVIISSNSFGGVSGVFYTGAISDNFRVPEPTSLALFGIGIAALGLRRRKA